MSVMRDIFGREVKVGDRVAVGMAYNRSSVLRVGEVISLKVTPYGHNEYKYSARIRWTHDGSPADNRWGVKESTILGASYYNYAKLVVLPEGFAEQFEEDIPRS